MLSHPSQNVDRLRRPKSTSTVRPKPASHALPEHVNPWIAQQQALVAATTAYGRAYGNEGIGERPTISREKSNASRKSYEGTHFPPRGSSLAFSLNGSPPRHRHHRSNTVDSNVSSQYYHPPNNVTSSIAVPPRESIRFELPNIAVRVATAEPALAAPLSGIRKVRSMFYGSNRRKPTMISPNSPTFNPNQGSMPRSRTQSALSDFEPSSYGTLAESASPDHRAQVKERYPTDSHAGIERDRSASVLGVFKRRREPAVTAPKRAEMDLNGVTFDSVDQPIDLAMYFTKTKEKKSRTFSGSLRSKIKKVFGKPSTALTEFPVQHVDAQREHFGKLISAPLPVSMEDGTCDSVRHREKFQIHTALPPGESYHSGIEHSHLHQRSFSGITTADTEQTKSRVTSWTASSIGDTVVSRDNKRLSVIREASRPSIGAETTQRQTSLSLGNRLFSRSKREDDPPFPVEPKRVYSALLKEIAKKEMEVVDAQRVHVHADGSITSSTLETLPSQKVGKAPVLPFGAMKTTIRAVHPEAERPGSKTGSIRGRVRIPAQQFHTDEPHDGSSGEFSQPVDGIAVYTQTSRHRASLSQSGLQRGQKATQPTSQQIALRVQKVRDRWKTPLEDESLPYSRKWNAAVGAANTSFGSALDYTPTHNKTSLVAQSPLQASQGGRPQMSPSIYSRETDDGDLEASPVDRDESPLQRSENEAAGTAVVHDSEAVCRHVIGSARKVSRGTHSAKSSRDWKAWLSKEIADLEITSQEDITISTDFDVMSGHHRELAQCMTDSGAVTPSDDSKKRQSAPRQPRSKGNSRSSSRMNDRFPMIETRKSSGQLRKTGHRRSSKFDSGATTVPRKSSAWMGDKVENAPAFSEQRANEMQVMQDRPKVDRSPPAMQPRPRSVSALANYTINALRTGMRSPRPSKLNDGAPAGRQQTRSLFDLGNRSTSSVAEPANANNAAAETYVSIQRKPITGRALEGETLEMILDGPYGVNGYQDVQAKMSRFKENSPRRREGGRVNGSHNAGDRRRSPSVGYRATNQLSESRSTSGLGRMKSESPAFV